MRTFRDNRATIFEAVYALRGYDDDDDDDEMMITIATMRSDNATFAKAAVLPHRARLHCQVMRGGAL